MRGVYTVEFDNVSVPAAQDLLAAYAGSTHKLEIHGIEIGAASGSTIQNVRLRVRRLPATVTAGSGGSTPTPQKTDPADAAASFTAHANDTTQATTSGTASTEWATVMNTTNGWQFWPPREDRPRCDLSEALVISLDTAPSPGLTLSGSMVIEER